MSVDKKSENEFLEALGAQIRTLRKGKKLTQENLAFEVGVNRSQIIRIESGQQGPGVEILKKIADAYNITLKELFDFEY